MSTTEEAKYLHKVERHEFQDALRHQATGQGRFDAAMLHFDHPLPGGGRVLEPSDGGAGAEAIYDWVGRPPRGRRALLWQRLWINAYAKLEPSGKDILNALKEDWRTAAAARIAGVSRPTVYRWKTFFKVHFAQCFQAYKRYSGGC